MNSFHTYAQGAGNSEDQLNVVFTVSSNSVFEGINNTGIDQRVGKLVQQYLEEDPRINDVILNSYCVSGRRMSNISAAVQTEVVDNYVEGYECFAVLLEDINEIFVDGESAKNNFSRYQDWFAAADNAGYQHRIACISPYHNVESDNTTALWNPNTQTYSTVNWGQAVYDEQNAHSNFVTSAHANNQSNYNYVMDYRADSVIGWGQNVLRDPVYRVDYVHGEDPLLIRMARLLADLALSILFP